MNNRFIGMVMSLFLLVFGSWGCQDSGMTNPKSPSSSSRTLSKPALHHLVEYNCTGTELAAAVQSVGGSVAALYPEIGAAKVINLTDQAAQQLRSVAGIQFVTRDAETQWVPDFTTMVQSMFDLNGVSTAPRQPGDATYFANQWALRAIKAPDAWKITMGSSEIRVGILDTGISPTHVDLAGKYDLSVSINLSTMNPTDPQDYIDRQFHGTYVSGIVSTNNIGLAGVAPNVRLVGIKVLGDDGRAPWANILAGILYAVDVADCDILNLSIGGIVSPMQNGRLIAMMQRAINHARARGALVVSAAGNESLDLDHSGAQFVYPAQAAGSMAVSATGPLRGVDPDQTSCYTNFGRSVISVAAPGGNYDCATGSALAQLDLIGSCLAPVVAQRMGLANPTQWYTRALGTSASAPFVSGTAALVMAAKGKHNPGFVQSRIESTADDLGQHGTDPYYGKGRLNAHEAVK